MSRLGVVASEVISLDPSHPQRVEHCAAFLRAQQQNAHEVRFFLGGRGLLSLHIGDYVYAVLCERNDVISIPAGVPRTGSTWARSRVAWRFVCSTRLKGG